MTPLKLFSATVVAIITVIALLYISPIAHGQSGGSGTINQLSPFTVSSGTVRLASTTANFRIPSLSSLNCLGTDSNGLLQAGVCTGGGGGGGGFPIYFQNGGATLNDATTTVILTPNSFSVVENPNNTLTVRVSTSTLGLLASAISDFVTTVRTSISETINGITYTSGTGVLSIDAGYGIPLTASTTNWESFYLTPSTRITAGTNLSWSGNTLNATGGTGSVSTSTPVSAGNLAFWTSSSALSQVATGTLTENATGLEFNATQGLVGGPAVLSISTGFVIPSTTRMATLDAFTATPSTVITAGTGIDWTGNTLNGVYTAGDGLTLTTEDFDCDIASGSIFGCLASSDWTSFNNKVSSTSIDTSAELRSLLTDETGTGATMFGITSTMSDDITCGASQVIARNSGDSAWECVAMSGGGGGSGGVATTTDTNDQPGEIVSYLSTDFYVGGSASTTAEFNFDKDVARFTISSTTANATGTITSPSGAIILGSTGERTEFNFNVADTLRLFSSTGVNTVDFGGLRASSTFASTSRLSLFGSLFDRTSSAGTNGQVLQSNGSGVTWVSTSTLGISGGTGSSIVYLASSTPWTAGNLAYVVSNGAVSSVATTTLTATAPIALSNPISVLGNTPSVLTCATASGSLAGCLSSTDWTSFNAKVSSTSIDTSTELGALVTDEVGSGSLVFNGSPNFTGTTSFINITATSATTTNFASTKLTPIGLGVCNGAGQKPIFDGSGTWSCGTDSGAGAGSGTISTSTPITTGTLAFFNGLNTIASVATGTLTETATGLEFDTTRGLVGGSSVLSLTTGFVIPSTTRAVTWDSAVASSHNPVTLSGALDYITLAGQDIVRGAIDLATDITGFLGITNGGTGTSTAPTRDSFLVGNGTNYDYRRIVAGSNITVSTSTAGQIVITGSAGGSGALADWNQSLGTYLTPSTTVGIRVNASSTIGNGTAAGGLTVAGGVTTTANVNLGNNYNTLQAGITNANFINASTTGRAGTILTNAGSGAEPEYRFIVSDPRNAIEYLAFGLSAADSVSPASFHGLLKNDLAYVFSNSSRDLLISSGSSGDVYIGASSGSGVPTLKIDDTTDFVGIGYATTTIGPSLFSVNGNISTANLYATGTASSTYASTSALTVHGNIFSPKSDGCASWSSGLLTTTGTACGTDGGGGGSSKWTDGTNFTYLTNSTYDLAIGAISTTSAPFWWDVSATTSYIGNGGAGDSVTTFGPVGSEWTMGYDYDANTFGISSSTVLGTNNFLTMFSTTSMLIASSTLGGNVTDGGVRMTIGNYGVGSIQYPPRHQLNLNGRIDTGDWVQSPCNYPNALAGAALSADTAAVCGNWMFQEDTTATLTFSFHNGVPSMIVRVGAGLASDGGGIFLMNNAGAQGLQAGSSTPFFQAVARIDTPANATNTRIIIGLPTETPNSSTFESVKGGCYFFSASSTPNWQFMCGASATAVDTGIASTTSATAGLNQFYKFNVWMDARKGYGQIITRNTVSPVFSIDYSQPALSLTPSAYVTTITAGSGNRGIEVKSLDLWYRIGL